MKLTRLTDGQIIATLLLLTLLIWGGGMIAALILWVARS